MSSEQEDKLDEIKSAVSSIKSKVSDLWWMLLVVLLATCSQSDGSKISALNSKIGNLEHKIEQMDEKLDSMKPLPTTPKVDMSVPPPLPKSTQ